MQTANRASRAAERRPARFAWASGPWPGVALSILAAAVVFTPVVVYQLQHFCLGWHDVGNYARSNYNFFRFGRFFARSDGVSDFFVDQHFEPFFFLLCFPVRLFGTPGFVGAITTALVLSAGYVFAFSREVTGSSRMAALCAAAYVANPYTGAIAFSYHPETFGILFLLAFAYHGRLGHSWRAWLALLLACTVKEDMWVYGIAIAILVGRRERWKQTAAFVAASLCYYAVAVASIGGSWYPTANYLNSFYETGGRPQTKLQIALGLFGRWREFVALLFTGPGLYFQLSMLFLGALSGWRYVFACGVMLLWLSYPGGPPRSTLQYYYSYAPLLVSFVILPYALVNLRAWVARGARPERWGERVPAAAMVLVLAACLVLHVPRYAPPAIRDATDYRALFSNPHRVNVPVVGWLIARFIAPNDDSVLSQFYVAPSIPQRPDIWVTLFDRQAFLERRLQPKYVLLDLGSDDPWTPEEDTRAMAALLRRGDAYRALYDAQGVLLYQRAD